MAADFEFTQIGAEPQNASQYLVVKRIENDQGLEFTKLLAAALRRGEHRVATELVHEDLVFIGMVASGRRHDYDAKKFVPGGRDATDGHGHFYLDRREEKNTPPRPPSALRRALRWLGRFLTQREA